MKNTNKFLLATLCAFLLVFGQSVAAQDREPIDGIDTVEEQHTKAPAENLDADQLWDRANTEYINNNFKGAIADYINIIEMGRTSSQLHYNLANSYFKDGQIGNAILNYRRAQMLNPSDGDIKYNLAIAQAQTKDKIEQVPVMFVKRIWAALCSLLSSNAWAMVAFALFVLAAVFTLVYLLAKATAVRRVGFISGVLCLLLFVMSVSFAIVQRSIVVHENEAVVMSAAVAAKSSPDKGSKDIFILHEGTSIKILNTLGEWSEVVLEDGNKGWLPSDSYQKVSLVD